jgi:hypothetical protein
MIPLNSPLESMAAGIRDDAPEVQLGRSQYVRECPLCGNPVHRLDRTCSECDTAPEQTQPPTLAQELEWAAQLGGLVATAMQGDEIPVAAVEYAARRAATWAHDVIGRDHAEGCDCPACPGGGGEEDESGCPECGDPECEKHDERDEPPLTLHDVGMSEMDFLQSEDVRTR